jgi:hypothetical protein
MVGVTVVVLLGLGGIADSELDLDTDCVSEGVLEIVCDSDADGETLPVSAAVLLRLAVSDRELDSEIVAETLVVGVGVTVGEVEIVFVSEFDLVSEIDKLLLVEIDADGVGVSLVVGVFEIDAV